MADYKEIVGGLLSKARDFAASDSVTGAVEKVKEVAAGTGIPEVFERGTQRAKSFSNATKLTIDLNRDHKELERVFCEIGKLYYDQARTAPEGFFAPLFEQVAALQDTIASREAEIEAYKASFERAEKAVSSDEDLNTRIDDFEAIVSQTENDGSST